MNERERGLLAINLAVLLFGTAGLFGKLLTISPIIIVLGRVAFASMTLSLFILIRKDKFIISRKISHLALLLILGIILAVHWLTFFHSIQISTVAVGLLSFATFPIFVSLLEPLLLKEKLSVRYIILAFITLLGIRLLVPRFELADHVTQGVLWGCLSGFLFALLIIINRKLVSHYKAGQIALYQNFIAMLFLIPISLNYLHQITHSGQIWMLVILGVVFTALSHTLYIHGLKTISGRTTSIITCLEPVYGIILAMLIIREMPDIRTITGGIIIIGSVIYTSVTKDYDKKLVEG